MYFWCWQRSTTKGLWPLTIWKVRLSTVAAEEEGKEGEQEHKRSLIKVYLHKNGISDACHMLHRRYHMWYFNWSSELSWSQCRPYWFHVHHFLFSNRRHSTDDWTVRLSEPTRWILSVSVSIRFWVSHGHQWGLRCTILSTLTITIVSSLISFRTVFACTIPSEESYCLNKSIVGTYTINNLNLKVRSLYLVNFCLHIW